jgi:hypothetical protein
MREQFVWEIVEMIFLSIKDSLFRACHLRRRYRCGSKKCRGYYGMSCVEKCTRSTYLHGFSGILSTVRRRFFEDRKFDYGVAEEKQEICMDREMCGKHFEGSRSC